MNGPGRIVSLITLSAFLTGMVPGQSAAAASCSMAGQAGDDGSACCVPATLAEGPAAAGEMDCCGMDAPAAPAPQAAQEAVRYEQDTRFAHTIPPAEQGETARPGRKGTHLRGDHPAIRPRGPDLQILFCTFLN